MTTAEWMIAAYLIIGASWPLAKLAANPTKFFDDHESEMALLIDLFGRSSTALIMSIAVLLAVVMSALTWPVMLFRRLTGRNKED